MTVALYMDHNVPRAITAGLQRRGIDVLRAYEDGAHEWEDAALLDRAQALGRALFSRDDDLLREVSRRQREEIAFGGVILCPSTRRVDWSLYARPASDCRSE